MGHWQWKMKLDLRLPKDQTADKAYAIVPLQRAVWLDNQVNIDGKQLLSYRESSKECSQQRIKAKAKKEKMIYFHYSNIHK